MARCENRWLAGVVEEQGRGVARGLYAVCSAQGFVLEAAVQQAVADGSPLLIESTSNQVNQAGGYTRLTPAEFRDRAWRAAEQWGLPRERLILGGDHLGPHPWRHLPAARAMDEARAMVRAYVLAGYGKIQLDCSVRCADDAGQGLLPAELAAERAAELAQAAEEAAAQAGPAGARPCYVIGTEVPPPGGSQDPGRPPHPGERPGVTAAADLEETIEANREAFRRRGLEAAWERAMAVVVQPGVEFGHEMLLEYEREAARPLARALRAYPGLVYEAHSTDYQTPAALRAMVEDGFAILKVGPALTFAFREAVLALGMMESEWLAGRDGAEPSRIGEVLEAAMREHPEHWRGYYSGTEAELRLARRYSLSDRARYYWPQPRVQEALGRLLWNLEAQPAPMELVSQFLPVQHARVRAGALAARPREMIYDAIRGVLRGYAAACGF